MKIKPPQILGGIAALTFIFSNFFYVVNWIVEGYGTPGWSLDFWSWPIEFVVKLVAMTVFIVVFNNHLLRYIAVGVYLFARLIYSLYWMINNEESITYFAKMFVDFPYWDSLGFAFVGQIFGFFSFVLFVIAVILSFINLSQSGTSAPGYSGNIPAPMSTNIPPAKPKQAQGVYGDIEVLGDLLAKGLITQREFDLKKREILGLDE
jgi:hypothetical protein